MLFTKIGSSYSSSQFPEEFSNQLYFSENVDLGEFAYKSSYSIKYVITGKEKYIVQGREMVIKPDQHLLVNNNSEVITLPSSGKAISLFIAPETLTDVKSLNNSNSLEKILDNYNSIKESPLLLMERTYDNENVQVQNILKKMAFTLSNNTYSGEYEIDPSFFFQLSEAVHSDQQLHSSRLSNLKSIKKSTIQEQYRRLLIGYHYLNDNWNRPFSLKNAAAISMLSPYHFHRLFQTCFSKTPYQHHLQIQMNKALKLLKENTLNISEISYILGYSSSTSFGRAFKKYFGTPPSCYLK